MVVSNVAYDTVLNNEEIIKSSIHTPPKGWGVRHLQTLLLFACLVMGFSMRSQLSVLMVAMIDSNNHENCNVTSNVLNESINVLNEKCKESQNVSNWSVYRTYEWDKSTQEMVTFSFFVGYTGMQLPMGWLAQKVGGKIPIMVALAVNGILSICMPWIPLIGGRMAVYAGRLLQGMTQAAFYPSMHTMLARWTPLRERGRLTTYAYSGSEIGTIVAFQVSGLLAGSPLLGWPASFWLFGVLSLIVCGLFGWLGAASPHEHSRLTTEELVYILEDCNADAVPKKRKTPWWEMLKCPSIWGIMISQAGSSAGYLLIFTEIPLYMSNILGVDIKRNGLYSSLPYIAMYVMSIALGYLADYARNRNMLKLVNIRRITNTIGMVVSGLFLVAFSFTSNTFLAVCLLILSLGIVAVTLQIFVCCQVLCILSSIDNILAFFFYKQLVNQIDLSPNFAGSIMALTNMFGNLTGLLVPVLVSNVVTDMKNQRQWQIVFLIVIGFQFITNTIFVIFAKAEVQPWNFYGDLDYESDEKESKLLEDVKERKEENSNKFNENCT